MTDPGATFKGNEAEKKSRKKREGGGDRWLGYGGGDQKVKKRNGWSRKWMKKKKLKDEEMNNMLKYRPLKTFVCVGLQYNKYNNK